MRESKQEGAVKSKSRQLQETGEMQLERVDAGEMFSPQRDPLVGISGMGSVPSASSHAAMLNRSPAAGQSSNRQLVLQLQRQYGNRYVNQVVQLARRGEALQTATSLEQDGTIQGKAEAIGEGIGASGVLQENKTGLPDNLKAGIENFSGISMDDVKVHYNSSKPAQLQALAYTQGTEIHVASGQEEHLPHEAWHVVQQMQGRVKPTMQMKGVKINDEKELETEADVMGQQVVKTRQDLFFKRGEYQQGSRGGQNLIAHKLTHVVQQNNDTVQESGLKITKAHQQSSENTVQLTMNHVNQLIKKYADLTEDRSAVGPYRDWTAVRRVNGQGHFSPQQWRKIQIAYRYKADGTPTIVDRSWNTVEEVDRSDESEDKKTLGNVEKKMGELQKNAPTHYAILETITGRINRNLGEGALLEFWKGAHIVFRDRGEMYETLKEMGGPIAARNKDGSIKSKSQFVGLTSFNYFGWSSSTTDQRAGRMMTRSPGTGETGHYKDQESTDTNNQGGVGGPPQYGIDMPEAVRGHLLFGLTYDGDTFVQTEGAGFQNFWEGSIAHGSGALTVRGLSFGSKRGMQTGMFGNSMHSEDPNVQTEIREHENANMSWQEFYDSIQ